MGTAQYQEHDELQRIYWRCRRGMLELDLLLRDFLDNDYKDLGKQHKKAFNRLIDYPDNVLLELLLGRTISSDQEIQRVIKKIRSVTSH